MNFQFTEFTDDVWRTLPIAAYLKKAKDPTFPEQYYQQLATRAAFLITGEGTDFAIVAFPDNTTIWVSAAYCTTGDFYEKYLDNWINLWVKPNFPAITCIKWNSRRKAYLRGFTKLQGYEIEAVIYRKDIYINSSNDLNV